MEIGGWLGRPLPATLRHAATTAGVCVDVGPCGKQTAERAVRVRLTDGGKELSRLVIEDISPGCRVGTGPVRAHDRVEQSHLPGGYFAWSNEQEHTRLVHIAPFSIAADRRGVILCSTAGFEHVGHSQAPVRVHGWG